MNTKKLNFIFLTILFSMSILVSLEGVYSNKKFPSEHKLDSGYYRMKLNSCGFNYGNAIDNQEINAVWDCVHESGSIFYITDELKDGSRRIKLVPKSGLVNKDEIEDTQKGCFLQWGSPGSPFSLSKNELNAKWDCVEVGDPIYIQGEREGLYRIKVKQYGKFCGLRSGYDKIVNKNNLNAKWSCGELGHLFFLDKVPSPVSVNSNFQANKRYEFSITQDRCSMDFYTSKGDIFSPKWNCDKANQNPISMKLTNYLDGFKAHAQIKGLQCWLEYGGKKRDGNRDTTWNCGNKKDIGSKLYISKSTQNDNSEFIAIKPTPNEVCTLEAKTGLSSNQYYSVWNCNAMIPDKIYISQSLNDNFISFPTGYYRIKINNGHSDCSLVTEGFIKKTILNGAFDCRSESQAIFHIENLNDDVGSYRIQSVRSFSLEDKLETCGLEGNFGSFIESMGSNDANLRFNCETKGHNVFIGKHPKNKNLYEITIGSKKGLCAMQLATDSNIKDYNAKFYCNGDGHMVKIQRVTNLDDFQNVKINTSKIYNLRSKINDCNFTVPYITETEFEVKKKIFNVYWDCKKYNKAKIDIKFHSVSDNFYYIYTYHWGMKCWLSGDKASFYLNFKTAYFDCSSPKGAVPFKVDKTTSSDNSYFISHIQKNKDRCFLSLGKYHPNNYPFYYPSWACYNAAGSEIYLDGTDKKDFFRLEDGFYKLKVNNCNIGIGQILNEDEKNARIDCKNKAAFLRITSKNTPGSDGRYSIVTSKNIFDLQGCTLQWGSPSRLYLRPGEKNAKFDCHELGDRIYILPQGPNVYEIKTLTTKSFCNLQVGNFFDVVNKGNLLNLIWNCNEAGDLFKLEKVAYSDLMKDSSEIDTKSNYILKTKIGNNLCNLATNGFNQDKFKTISSVFNCDNNDNSKNNIHINFEKSGIYSYKAYTFFNGAKCWLNFGNKDAEVSKSYNRKSAFNCKPDISLGTDIFLLKNPDNTYQIRSTPWNSELCFFEWKQGSNIASSVRQYNSKWDCDDEKGDSIHLVKAKNKEYGEAEEGYYKLRNSHCILQIGDKKGLQYDLKWNCGNKNVIKSIVYISSPLESDGSRFLGLNNVDGSNGFPEDIRRCSLKKVGKKAVFDCDLKEGYQKIFIKKTSQDNDYYFRVRDLKDGSCALSTENTVGKLGLIDVEWDCKPNGGNPIKLEKRVLDYELQDGFDKPLYLFSKREFSGRNEFCFLEKGKSNSLKFNCDGSAYENKRSESKLRVVGINDLKSSKEEGSKILLKVWDPTRKKFCPITKSERPINSYNEHDAIWDCDSDKAGIFTVKQYSDDSLFIQDLDDCGLQWDGSSYGNVINAKFDCSSNDNLGDSIYTKSKNPLLIHEQPWNKDDNIDNVYIFDEGQRKLAYISEGHSGSTYMKGTSAIASEPDAYLQCIPKSQSKMKTKFLCVTNLEDATIQVRGNASILDPNNLIKSYHTNQIMYAPLNSQVSDPFSTFFPKPRTQKYYSKQVDMKETFIKTNNLENIFGFKEQNISYIVLEAYNLDKTPLQIRLKGEIKKEEWDVYMYKTIQNDFGDNCAVTAFLGEKDDGDRQKRDLCDDFPDLTLAFALLFGLQNEVNELEEEQGAVGGADDDTILSDVSGPTDNPFPIADQIVLVDGHLVFIESEEEHSNQNNFDTEHINLFELCPPNNEEQECEEQGAVGGVGVTLIETDSDGNLAFIASLADYGGMYVERIFNDFDEIFQILNIDINPNSQSQRYTVLKERANALIINLLNLDFHITNYKNGNPDERERSLRIIIEEFEQLRELNNMFLYLAKKFKGDTDEQKEQRKRGMTLIANIIKNIKIMEYRMLNTIECYHPVEWDALNNMLLEQAIHLSWISNPGEDMLLCNTISDSLEK